MIHKTVRIKAGHYNYRGFEIWLHDDPSGGPRARTPRHWQVKFDGAIVDKTPTIAEARWLIDQLAKEKL
jgi:hypothetical protein